MKVLMLRCLMLLTGLCGCMPKAPALTKYVPERIPVKHVYQKSYEIGKRYVVAVGEQLVKVNDKYVVYDNITLRPESDYLIEGEYKFEKLFTRHKDLEFKKYQEAYDIVGKTAYEGKDYFVFLDTKAQGAYCLVEI